MKRNPVALVVEDDPTHRLLIRRCIGDDRTVDLQEANDGEEAIEYLYGRGKYADRGRFPMPHVILLDLRMPRMDGWEVLQTVKGDRLLKDIPVVLLSSLADEEDVKKGYHMGANAYVTKPFDFDEFNEKLKSLGRFWMGTVETPFSA